VAQHVEQAKKLLTTVATDAIMILHSSLPQGRRLGAELKSIAPRTPVILFDNETDSPVPPEGIDSLCRADLQDESVTRAVAIFFRQILTLSRRQKHIGLQGGSMSFPISVSPRLEFSKPG